MVAGNTASTKYNGAAVLVVAVLESRRLILLPLPENKKGEGRLIVPPRC